MCSSILVFCVLLSGQDTSTVIMVHACTLNAGACICTLMTVHACIVFNVLVCTTMYVHACNWNNVHARTMIKLVWVDFCLI